MLKISPNQKKHPLKQYALDVITDNIVQLNLLPGEAINEAELSEQLEISRTPIREALLELANNQLVIVRPRSGTFVNHIDLNLIDQYLYLRLLIESDLVRQLCSKMSLEDSNKLHELVAIQSYYLESKQRFQLVQKDMEFHYNFYKICHKETVYHTTQSLMVHFNRLRYLSTFHNEFPARISEHHALLNAIAANDPAAAAEILKKHLYHTYEDFDLAKQIYPHYLTEESRSFIKQS